MCWDLIFNHLKLIYCSLCCHLVKYGIRNGESISNEQISRSHWTTAADNGMLRWLLKLKCEFQWKMKWELQRKIWWATLKDTNCYKNLKQIRGAKWSAPIKRRNRTRDYLLQLAHNADEQAALKMMKNDRIMRVVQDFSRNPTFQHNYETDFSS